MKKLKTASLPPCLVQPRKKIAMVNQSKHVTDCIFSSFSGNPIEDNSLVVKVSLTPTTETAQSSVHKSSEIRSIGKTRPTAGLTLSSSGTWLVAIAGHKAYVAKTSQLKSGFTKFVSPEKLTCLAIHPNEEYFATGDTKGNIKLWYCLHDGIFSIASGVEKRAQTTSFHWHAHAVSSISFTPNGAYLLSGGEEAVLVIWQLHTGKKEFVPRVGAPISSISVSPASEREEEYLLGLADATHAFVSSGSLRLSRSFSRIKLGKYAFITYLVY
jgi:NET1-associated nuclear protein 1 (U3 small nucleolar RNA-associated protein 17)